MHGRENHFQIRRLRSDNENLRENFEMEKLLADVEQTSSTLTLGRFV